MLIKKNIFRYFVLFYMYISRLSPIRTMDDESFGGKVSKKYNILATTRTSLSILLQN